MILGNSLDVNNNKLLNIADGVADSDGVNLGQLNSIAGGIVGFTANYLTVAPSGAQYTTVKSAMDNASVGDTILVLEDVTETASIAHVDGVNVWIPNNVTVNLDTFQWTAYTMSTYGIKVFGGGRILGAASGGVTAYLFEGSGTVSSICEFNNITFESDSIISTGVLLGSDYINYTDCKFITANGRGFGTFGPTDFTRCKFITGDNGISGLASAIRVFYCEFETGDDGMINPSGVISTSMEVVSSRFVCTGYGINNAGTGGTDAKVSQNSFNCSVGGVNGIVVITGATNDIY
jgi:hypothetical protein